MKIYETKEGVTEYIKLCEGYDNSKFKGIILEHLKPNSEILEIGMGPGNDFEWLSQDYRVTGSDYSEEFIKRAKERFPNGKFKLIDALMLNTNDKYDAIYSCKVYQHFGLLDIEKALRKQSQIVRGNGLIIHSFWIGDTVFDDGDMKAIYHNKEKLLSVIGKSFDLLVEELYEEFESNDSLFIIARKRN